MAKARGLEAKLSRVRALRDAALAPPLVAELTLLACSVATCTPI